MEIRYLTSERSSYAELCGIMRCKCRHRRGVDTGEDKTGKLYILCNQTKILYTFTTVFSSSSSGKLSAPCIRYSEITIVDSIAKDSRKVMHWVMI